MKVAGVIAEFDPFHNGHAYFLRRVRELTSADFIVVVMSGDYTQRGNISLMGKALRARAAMQNGADAVIELPVQYATSSAELFASGAVSVLEALKIIDHLCFGTETNDLKALISAADILSEETEAFRERLDEKLKQGMSYPAARLEAIRETGAYEGQADMLCLPNNILAVEYLKALNKLGSGMQPVNVKRETVDHDDANTYGIYSSAKNIRETMRITHSLDSVEMYLPENTLLLLREHYQADFPIFADDLSLLVKYRLSMETEESLMRYADMSRDLSHRIINHRNDITEVTRFTELIKTRNITYTRISRALLHMLLGITREDMKSYADAGMTGYVRLLGFRKEASPLIDMMNQKSAVPVLSRLADYKKMVEPPFDRMLSDTLRASDIYNYVIKDTYDTDIPADISHIAVSADGMILI